MYRYQKLPSELFLLSGWGRYKFFKCFYIDVHIDEGLFEIMTCMPVTLLVISNIKITGKGL